MAISRLDKLLSQSGERTRSEAAKLIRAGRVSVDGAAQTDPAYKTDAAESAVLLDGQRIEDTPYQYVMLHKPAGVVSASRDTKAETVMRFLPEAMRARRVMPVGRLDKDTTGLLLLTNDGRLSHRLLAPKTHVWKEYLVTVDGPLTTEHAAAFARGVQLGDFTALPAQLHIESASAAESRALVKLREGKYHQVKRMILKFGLQVTTLHRLAFGPLKLDIPPGEYRALDDMEIEALYLAAGMDRDGRHG
ncbi:MAG: rRNA pseudouridine synthase [Clostridiales bacterium]|nr:rRNA pseudouridine synthase [Clostridiales bacterium]